MLVRLISQLKTELHLRWDYMLHTPDSNPDLLSLSIRSVHFHRPSSHFLLRVRWLKSRSTLFPKYPVNGISWIHTALQELQVGALRQFCSPAEPAFPVLHLTINIHPDRPPMSPYSTTISQIRPYSVAIRQAVQRLHYLRFLSSGILNQGYIGNAPKINYWKSGDRSRTWTITQGNKIWCRV